MEAGALRDLETIFRHVEDPRVERTKRHRLRDSSMLAIGGVICGADGWVELEEFGKAKAAWFTEMRSLPHGIPSPDPFGRVFAHLDPTQFAARFFRLCPGNQHNGSRGQRDRGQDAAPLS